jgi:hypothetical protein
MVTYTASRENMHQAVWPQLFAIPMFGRALVQDAQRKTSLNATTVHVGFVAYKVAGAAVSCSTSGFFLCQYHCTLAASAANSL